MNFEENQVTRKKYESLSKSESNINRYGFCVGSLVLHLREMDGEAGVVLEIDSEHDQGDVTTCRVLWGVTSLNEAISYHREDSDIVWTNKLCVADKDQSTVTGVVK